MPAPANLIHETSTTTGTGNFTVAAVNGKVRFSDSTYGFGTGGSDVFWYFISNQSAAEWEIGTGSMSDANTLVRDTVISSSNSDALVSFSAGTKDVTNDVPAAIQAAASVTLASGSATSGSVVSINGFFTSAYTFYEVRFSKAVPSADARLSLRVMVAGTAKSGAADYHWVTQVNTDSANAILADTSDSEITLTFADTESSVADGVSGIISINDPLDTTAVKQIGYDRVANRRSDGLRDANRGVGTYIGATSALSGIQFIWDGGENFQNIIWTLVGYPD